MESYLLVLLLSYFAAIVLINVFIIFFKRDNVVANFFYLTLYNNSAKLSDKIIAAGIVFLVLEILGYNDSAAFFETIALLDLFLISPIVKNSVE